LFGTRTTIGSGEHTRRLVLRGVDPGRIVAEPCHGLAAAIDKDPDSPAVPGLVEDCVLRALPRIPPAASLYAGLACTHYAYVREAFVSSLARHSGVRVEALDPGQRLVDALADGPGAGRLEAGKGNITVEVVSKVGLAAAQREAVARRIEPVSAATARALREYRHVPGLF